MAKQKYNVLMACGAGFLDVEYKPTEEDQTFPFRVLCNEGELRRPLHKDGKRARCLDCKCKRKAKRKQDMFFTEEDKQLKRRPTGISVTCHISEIEEL
jgi:hypothetical protein